MLWVFIVKYVTVKCCVLLFKIEVDWMESTVLRNNLSIQYSKQIKALKV